MSFNLASYYYTGKNYDISSQDTNAVGLFFSSDGLNMYVSGNAASNNKVWQYSLATAWDVTTATYASKFYDFGPTGSSIKGLFFSSDGTKMYVIDSFGLETYCVMLTSAWDISTASSLITGYNLELTDSGPQGIAFSSSGTIFYMVGSQNNCINAWNVSPAWSVNGGISYAGLYQLSDVVCSGISFTSDGLNMIYTGYSKQLHQNDLLVAWDINSSSFDKSHDISAQVINADGTYITNDLKHIYAVDSGNAKVFQYQQVPPQGLVFAALWHNRG
jgi:sugar lactone lactonase YvrE